jgi:hypothetical protein
MSPEEVVIDGEAFVPSRDAARRFDHAADYISRLARGGLVKGKIIKRIWYVSIPSLEAFFAEQARQKELWRAELARQRREEQIRAGHPSAMLA